jgi:hypothetical protein
MGDDQRSTPTDKNSRSSGRQRIRSVVVDISYFTTTTARSTNLTSLKRNKRRDKMRQAKCDEKSETK